MIKRMNKKVFLPLLIVVMAVIIFLVREAERTVTRGVMVQTVLATTTLALLVAMVVRELTGTPHMVRAAAAAQIAGVAVLVLVVMEPTMAAGAGRI